MSECKADGGMPFFIFKFRMTTTTNEEIVGYGYVPEGLIIKDSFNNAHYFSRILDQGYENKPLMDSMAFYRGELSIVYKDLNPEAHKHEMFTLIALTDLYHISFKRIKKISVDSIIPYSWVPAISNQLNMADTAWLNKKLVRDVPVTGYACYFQVQIFEETEHVKKMMKVILKLSAEIAALQKGTEFSQETANDKEQEIMVLLKKLHGQKVVVIEQCSC